MTANLPVKNVVTIINKFVFYVVKKINVYS